MHVESFLSGQQILACAPPDPAFGEVIGHSREGRELRGYRFGRGKRQVSLIAGCHADEPVGPAMLDRLVSWLAGQGANQRVLEVFSFSIVPHANPDGEQRNAVWARQRAAQAEPGEYELAEYLQNVVRELPGDDVEFGFPREGNDEGARPENKAIAAFLKEGGPCDLHGTFHGMAFAAGPWFLMEKSWAKRSEGMRRRLRAEVAKMGYVTHDVDRKGDKGFERIDEGFTTRPDSKAMIAHFQAIGDEKMAALFRPSSMEFVRSLGGDPLTLVSEMPLFLLPRRHYQGEELIRPEAIFELRRKAGDPKALQEAADRHGAKPMPIRDQIRLQLLFLQEALDLVSGGMETLLDSIAEKRDATW